MLRTYWQNRAERKAQVKRLYQAVNAQARQPGFYLAGGVPDTLDGRFELLLLHATLAWRRLEAQGPQGRRVAQALFDLMFTDIHHALRQIGVGDLSVPRHIKRMMKAYKGRALNYDRALRAADPAALAEALRRNLYATVAADTGAATVEAMAAYVREAAALFDAQAYDTIMAGHLQFPPLPAFQENAHDPRMVA